MRASSVFERDHDASPRFRTEHEPTARQRGVDDDIVEREVLSAVGNSAGGIAHCEKVDRIGGSIVEVPQ